MNYCSLGVGRRRNEPPLGCRRHPHTSVTSQSLRPCTFLSSLLMLFDKTPTNRKRAGYSVMPDGRESRYRQPDGIRFSVCLFFCAVSSGSIKNFFQSDWKSWRESTESDCLFFLNFLFTLVRISMIRWSNHVRRFGSQSSLDILAFPLSILFLSFLKYWLNVAVSVWLLRFSPTLLPCFFRHILFFFSLPLWLPESSARRDRLIWRIFTWLPSISDFSRTLTPGLRNILLLCRLFDFSISFTLDLKRRIRCSV